MIIIFLFSLQIELIDRVDDIYRNTTWDDEFKGYGVQIQQVCVCGWLHVVLRVSPLVQVVALHHQTSLLPAA